MSRSDVRISEVLSNLSLWTPMDRFLKKILEGAMRLFDSFEYGAIFLKGCDRSYSFVYSGLEKPNLKGLEMPRSIVSVFQGENVPEGLRSAKLETVLIISIHTEKATKGALILGSAKKLEVSEDEIVLARAFSRFASMFVTMKMSQERERRYQKGVIMAMTNLMEMRDPYTVGHSGRVAKLSAEIAKAMRLPRGEIDKIYWASIVHDIGKMGVPESVLMKPGNLTQEEWDLIKLHPVFSEEAISRFEWLEEIRPLVRHHHEWYSGKGYPDGLRRENIPLGARVIAVADSFDAMTSDRAYRKSLGFERALKELYDWAGEQFDPYVVRKALGVLKKKKLA